MKIQPFKFTSRDIGRWVTIRPNDYDRIHVPIESVAPTSTYAILRDVNGEEIMLMRGSRKAMFAVDYYMQSLRSDKT